MKETDIAYLAGYIDGDGSISIQSNRGKYHPRVTISNNHRESLEWCRDLIGNGSISEKWPLKEHWSISYDLTWIYDTALLVAEMCCPYLKIKKKRAKLLGKWKSATPRNGYYTYDLRQQKLALINQMKIYNVFKE